MLDKERKAERLAKVYKKKHIKNVKNGELQFSTKRIKMKEDNGCYHYIYIYIYTHTRARASGRQEVLIWNYYWLLRSYDVVASKCMQERNSKGFNIRLRNFPLNLFVIRGRIILKRERMIRSNQGQIRTFE